MAKTPLWKKKGAARKRAALARRRRRGGVNLTKMRTLNPVPQRMIAKHKYASTVQVPISGGAGLWQINLNSVYDPDRTGTGHQPYGRDTYAQLYNRYRVIGCRYAVAIAPENPNQVCQLVAVPTCSSVIPYPDCATAREQPRAKYIVQNPGAPARFVKGYVSLPQLQGLTTTQYMAGDVYQAQTGSNPSELAILNLVCSSITDVGGSFSGYLHIELVYTVEWFDPIVLPQS